MQALEQRVGRTALVDALRDEAAAMRRQAAEGGAVDDAGSEIERLVAARFVAGLGASLRRVINATGVIVHTNLGRAPLPAAAAARVAALAAGYSNLEFDLDEGRRGRRDTHAERLICSLTGAAAAVVVNNNAAATMLVLAALAAGREVIISRGEMVEIGGGFRVPDVMAQSGALLREVGTTNRTRAADYAAAITGHTALLLRVHPSNFRIEGFVERPSLDEIVAIGRRFDVPVAEDLGSGWIAPAPDGPPALRHEPAARESIASGADVVMFSGDKLLGGPQAGIIAGAAEAVGRVRRHPLMRALRTDKMTYAALEATLEEHLAGRARHTVPVHRMLALTPADLEPRAEALAAALRARGIAAAVVDGLSTIGGGSAPGSSLPTRLVALDLAAGSPDRLAAALRRGSPPVVARIDAGRVVADLRTVEPEDDAALVLAIVTASQE
jgi:L-seryl-tRNA(Ser) seleniumtransferase